MSVVEIVVADAVRTPIGRQGGGLAEVRADDLAAVPLRALLARTGISASEVEDVSLGCANQAGEDNRNVGRMAVLLAGMPVEVAGQTVNRLCGSGMQAVVSTIHSMMAGCGEVAMAGGVESMTRAPYAFGKSEGAFPRGDLKVHDTTLGWRFVNPKMHEAYPTISLGDTAEEVASRHNISRADQDRFALSSQQKYAAAAAAGRFRDELVPVPLAPGKDGTPRAFEADEHPRPDTTLEKLSGLKPAFRPNGTVTAGNASGINDGACALLLMTGSRARAIGHKPLARLVASAWTGVHPHVMGIGPIPATQKALSRAGLSIADIGLAELNEAFASQSLACVRGLGLRDEIVNVNGGAIALGHPLGCSGARIVTTLLHEMRRRGVRYGLATMCIGVGQGIATIWENAAL